MKILKKYYKLIIIVLVVLIIGVLSLVIYNNLFKQGTSNRLEGIEDYKISNKEISKVEQKFKEIEDIESIDIYTNYKILKIMLVLNKETDFNIIKDISNQAVQEFTEKNLAFYDVELFVNCNLKESEIYPKIGYKYKKNTEFAWNR